MLNNTRVARHLCTQSRHKAPIATLASVTASLEPPIIVRTCDEITPFAHLVCAVLAAGVARRRALSHFMAAIVAFQNRGHRGGRRL